MRYEDPHPSDQDLILLADGELSVGQTLQARDHLAACWECRAKMAEIEDTIVEFVRFHRDNFGARLQPIDGPRALLRAQLAQSAKDASRRPLRRIGTLLNRTRIAYAFAVLVCVVAGAKILSWAGAYKNVYAAPLPNPALTPGATQSISLASICSSTHDQVVRRVPDSVRQQVFREYGIVGAPSKDYEIDHLVTPGLGGSDDIRNLWPEPRYRTTWNSFVKDQLEDHLHHLVCDGQVSLSTAQHEISSDWISAYRKYFHTDEPLLPYSSSMAPSLNVADGPDRGGRPHSGYIWEWRAAAWHRFAPRPGT